MLLLVSGVVISGCGTMRALPEPVKRSEVMSVPRAEAWRLVKRVIPWSVELESERAGLLVYRTLYGRNVVRISILVEAESPSSTRIHVQPTYLAVPIAEAGAAERAVFEMLSKAVRE